MEQVQAFKATDGTLFLSAESAQEYETSLRWQSRIEEFSQTKRCPYPSGTQHGMMRKIIIGWEFFKAESLEKP